ncbi:gas vesicle protein [Saccharopolyspora sp. NPDC002376]
MTTGHAVSTRTVRDTREIALVDLLDRLLAGGVVLTGDVTISLAGVDLVRVSLRAIITSIQESTMSVDSWERSSDE